MREIKFRAWENPEVHPKGYCINPNFKGKMHYIDVGDKFLTFIGQRLEDKEYILMQYTGLKDKNGVEIYEGDIFNCIYDFEGCKCKMVMVWSDSLARFTLQRHGACQQPNVSQTIFDMTREEVIGNIYETPELLEKK